MEEQVPRVVIGMDPHKRSVTIEVMLADEAVVGGGRFDTTVEGYAAMLEQVAAWPDRVRAIEGCEGIGRHIAHRLLADGQDIVDVPAKLSARARVFATGPQPRRGSTKPSRPTPRSIRQGSTPPGDIEFDCGISEESKRGTQSLVNGLCRDGGRSPPTVSLKASVIPFTSSLRPSHDRRGRRQPLAHLSREGLGRLGEQCAT